MILSKFVSASHNLCTLYTYIYNVRTILLSVDSNIMLCLQKLVIEQLTYIVSLFVT